MSRAGRNSLTQALEMSLADASDIKLNCAAITPAKMVRRTATDACNAPRKGMIKLCASSPIVNCLVLSMGYDIAKVTQGYQCILHAAQQHTTSFRYQHTSFIASLKRAPCQSGRLWSCSNHRAVIPLRGASSFNMAKVEALLFSLVSSSLAFFSHVPRT